MAAIVWLVNAGMPRLVDWIQGVQAPPEAARLFVVDTSSSMTGSLGGRSKFNRVLHEVGQLTRNEPDGVAYALRTTGGGCGALHEPQVGFKTGDAESIPAKLKTVPVGGAGDIVAALRQATNDFRRYGAARSAGSKTIWLFLGTTKDDCDAAHLSLGKAIKNALVDASAKLSQVDFFVLRRERKRLSDFRKDIAGLNPNISFYGVTTEKELHAAIVDTARRENVSH